MEDVVRNESISQLDEKIGIETFHPLVSVNDFEKMNPTKAFQPGKVAYGF